MEFYLNAFVQLSSDKHDGGSIPWTAIDRYAQRYSVDGTDFDVFLDLIRALERSQRKQKADNMTAAEEPAKKEMIGGQRS